MPGVPREGHGQPEGGSGTPRRSSRRRLRARPALPAARVCPACLLRAGSAPAAFPGIHGHTDRWRKGLGCPHDGLRPNWDETVLSSSHLPEGSCRTPGVASRLFLSPALVLPGATEGRKLQPPWGRISRDPPGTPRVHPGHPLGTHRAEPRHGWDVPPPPVPSPKGDSDPTPRVAVSPAPRRVLSLPHRCPWPSPGGVSDIPQAWGPQPST